MSFEIWCNMNLVPVDLQDICRQAFEAGAKQRAKRAFGFVNARAVSTVSAGMVACSHIHPTKTEFASVPVFVEDAE